MCGGGGILSSRPELSGEDCRRQDEEFNLSRLASQSVLEMNQRFRDRRG